MGETHQETALALPGVRRRRRIWHAKAVQVSTLPALPDAARRVKGAPPPLLPLDSCALELILTGRAGGAEEALRIGLISEVTEDGQALARALALARTLSGLRQTAMRNDRMPAIEQWDLSGPAIANEVAWGLKTLASGEASAGSARFRSGAGRHGRPVSETEDNSTSRS